MQCIALDIETYGACERRTPGGDLLPPQRVFHPVRSLRTDLPSQLILTTSITEVLNFDGPGLTALSMAEPSDTMTFHFPDQIELLFKWLIHADVLIGMNLPFDLLYLRTIPLLRHALTSKHHTLIDLSILNYLHDESRPERSLKALGPILRTHAYDRTIKDGRFPHPHDPDFLAYAAADPHNTVLACRELARRIARDFPVTDKLSPACLTHYSEVLHTTIHMAEAGVPHSLPALASLHRRLLARSQRLGLHARSHYNLVLSSSFTDPSLPGPLTSRDRLLELAAHGIPPTYPLAEALADPSLPIPYPLLGHLPLVLTDKQKKISFCEENRTTLSQAHHPRSPVARALRLASIHNKIEKLISTYTWPRLLSKRRNPLNRSSVLIPPRPFHLHPVNLLDPGALPDHLPPIAIAYPTWYPTPGPPAFEGSGESGGTVQGRITCKNPPLQTDPPPIKKLWCSRWPAGVFLSFDLSQIELRVAALLSQEPSLLDAYLHGTDLHRERASLIYGIPPTLVTHSQRQAGKTINFADLFLAGAHRIQQSLLEMTGTHYDWDFCQDIVDARPRQRPVLFGWQQELIRTARTKGHLVLPITGQSRYFLRYADLRGGDSKDDMKEIVNFPIQTTAGNTLLSIQSWLRQHLPPGILMCLNVYDAVYFDCRTPTLAQELEDVLLPAAIRHEEESGYWSKVARDKHTPPLKYEVSPWR